MIILFHCLSIIIFQLLRNRKRIKFLEKIEEEKTNLESTSSTEKLDLEHKIKFRPPLFRQRYAKVYDILLDERWRTNIKKLVDFGCSEFHMFTYLKRLSGINEIFFVDIDEKMLWRYQTRTYPLTTEYLQRRKTPLAVSIFAGSVADPDYRLLETDAVTAVELVEHLYPDVLDAFPYNIFNFIEPKLVMITTPNADFNMLFGNNTTRFRHYDHKFEWSREQFEDWARNIVVRFPDYIVSFCGLGNGPMGTEHLGQCTQMALFIRKDLLEDGYVSKTYGTPCLCTSDSRCKGLTAASKMLCNCVCALCSPSASYGVCTYYSYSMQMITYEIEDDEEQNPSYNIYYKCIHKADFPFDDDQRSEEEKFMDDFRYKIHNFGQMTSIYYNEEANRSEIPISFLIWEPSGGESISATEACKILIKYSFQVEACFIKQTGLYEDCVIYEPVMEEISSSSEASGYDSDYTKYQLNEESLSDWDEPYVKTETKKPSETLENTEDMSCVKVTEHDNQLELPADTEEDKKQDSLFDSGYQKSLSLLDDSPQTPIEDLEETDLFEDTTSTPSLSSEDNKVHLRRTSNLEKQSFIPVATDYAKLKLDVNRINELDKFHNMPPGRPFLNHHVKQSPEVFKKSFVKEREPLPGPSNVQFKKRKKFKKLATDSEDDSPLEDVKSITNCIIENTLNKIDVEDEDKNGLIEYADPEPELPLPVLVNEAPLEFALVVENGDLANNNRDIEGNNYIAQEEADDFIGNDIANDNFEIVEDLPQVREENANLDNNNGQVLALAVIEDPPVMFNEPNNVENAEIVQSNEVAGASREALFDPNSEQDLLTDFDIPPPLQEANIVDLLNMGNSIVVIGVQPTDPDDIDPGLSTDFNGFPNWLLQILGTQSVIDEVTPPGSQEEPHFYCQGDGLGVHPSVIAVEIDDDDEESTDSSNNTTADFAEVDQGLSSQDMSSLPEDSVGNPIETHDVLLETDNEETEEAGVGPTTSEQNESSPNSSSDKGSNDDT